MFINCFCFLNDFQDILLLCNKCSCFRLSQNGEKRILASSRVRPSVCEHGTVQLPQGGFSWNLISASTGRTDFHQIWYQLPPDGRIFIRSDISCNRTDGFSSNLISAATGRTDFHRIWYQLPPNGRIFIKSDISCHWTEDFHEIWYFIFRKFVYKSKLH